VIKKTTSNSIETTSKLMGTIFRDDPLILNLNGILFKKKEKKKC